jgi:hypothetical protein
MPIYPRVNVVTTVVTEKIMADESTPIDVTLAVAATAEDLATVPFGKKGRSISLINEGPGDVALKFDGVATEADVLIKEAEGYSEANLEIAANVSFINVTPAQTPRVRGVLWSGAIS